MKRLFLIAILLIACIFLTSCTALTILFVGMSTMGTHYYEDPEDYGKYWVEEPAYMPDSIDELKVETYSYTLYEYFDTCYEIFLDVTVTEEEFDSVLAEVRASGEYICEQEAPYAEGYVEIVFMNLYKNDKAIIGDGDNPQEQVGYACIEKVIYNRATLSIIFVSIHAHDTGVYDVKDLEYFTYFSIVPEDYVEYQPIEKQENEATE